MDLSQNFYKHTFIEIIKHLKVMLVYVGFIEKVVAFLKVLKNV